MEGMLAIPVKETCITLTWLAQCLTDVVMQ